MIKTFSKSVTLSNGGGNILFSNIALTGYTAIGIVQCNFSSSWIAPTGMYVDSAGAHVTVRDVGSPTSSSVTVNCYAKVLYVKKIIKLSQTAKYQMYQYQNGFLTNS